MYQRNVDIFLIECYNEVIFCKVFNVIIGDENNKLSNFLLFIDEVVYFFGEKWII